MRRLPLLLGLAGMIVVAGCGGGGTPLVDAATDGTGGDGGVDLDAAAIDAGAIDAAAIDAAAIDAAAIDAAAIDAAAIDAAAIDAGAIDAAAIDAAAIDAAAIDAPAIDASAIDASAIDAGAIDAAAIDAPVIVVDAAIDSAPSVFGCADGTREGFVDPATFPGLAACEGTWTGDVSNAAPLCAPGWHVCVGAEPPLAAASYAQATAFAGCFAIDAAQDNNNCFADCSHAVEIGVDTAGGIDMGAVGASCPFQFPTFPACLGSGRIDASENTGTGCDFNPGVTTGAVCCVG